MHKHLDFYWLEYLQKSYSVFKRRRGERGMTDLKFQVGLPTRMGGTFGLMGLLNGLRYASAFYKRMAYEANEMLKIPNSGDIIFRLEMPREMAMA